MSRSVVLALVLLQAVLGASAAEGWGYTGSHGPDAWSETYPDCAGQRQSPVDLSKCEKTDKPTMTWSGYDDLPNSMTLKNNGHSVVLTSEGVTPRITFKDGRIFQLDNVHFHWGKKNKEGSEHTLEGERYSMEMHAVHMRVDEDGNPVTPTEAIVITAFLKVPDSLIYIPFVSPWYESNGLDAFISKLKDVVDADSDTSVKPFRWSKLLHEFTGNFMWYEGSLTTPPCSEFVTFYFDQRIQKVSSKQIAKFRKLKNSEGENMSGNFRPLQKLNGRKIYCHK